MNIARIRGRNKNQDTYKGNQFGDEDVAFEVDPFILPDNHFLGRIRIFHSAVLRACRVKEKK